MDGINQSIAPGINGAVELGVQNKIDSPIEDERMQRLSAKLIAKGREADWQRAVSNEDYRLALYDEFEI